MATIPMGEFGQARAVPQPQVSRVDLRGLGQEAGAVESLGQAAIAVGERGLQLEQRRILQAQQASEELARARGTNALLDYDVQIKAVQADLKSRVDTGALSWQQLPTAADEAFRKIETPTIEGLAAPDMERVQGGFARSRQSAMLGIASMAETAKRTEFKGQILRIRDTLGKQASDPTADIGRLIEMERASRDLAVAAGMGETFDKDSQDFADKAYSNNAKARFNVVRDDAEGLKQLMRDLTEDGGYYAGKLDADRKNAVVSQILVAQARLEAKDATTLARKEAAGERAIAALDRQISTGVQAPLDFYEKVGTAVAGTSFEDAYRERLAQEVEVQKALALPMDQQAAFVQRLEATQAREGATVTQQQNLDRLKRNVAENAKSLSETPLLFHSKRTGEEVEPLNLQTLVGGDTSEVQAQMADRMVTLRAIRSQYGDRAGNAPLLPQEADTLAGMLKQATPRQAAELFGSLSNAINDPEAYRAAMQQIAPDSPVRAYAGMIFAEQRSTTLRSANIFRSAIKAEAGDVARTMLEGEALLNRAGEDGKGGAFPMPSAREIGTEFEARVGKAFAGHGQAAQYGMQAVRAHYAGASAQAGDLTGELDTRRLQQSIRAVLGEPVDINGGEVFPPWGMDGAAFEDALETQWEQVRGTLPEGAARNFALYTPRQAGSGSYRLLFDGKFLTDANGEPITLVVRP